ncbi:MAG: M28 family peptidase [Verrucomicrobiae bacterium]|nr:M28 family peptidase [Verrucomicrobiae bacterium]
MRRQAKLWILFVTLWTCALAETRAGLVSDIVNQVSQSSYQFYLDNLLYAHNGDNRGLGGAQHDLAQANIYNQFVSYGLQTSLDPFPYNGNTYYNVVGVLPGTSRASQFYIVGAHYDSVGNPGADDNASGVAGVLEAARVLSQYEFEASLVFIAFDREEQGLFGSQDYASEHWSDDIRAMISLDMIGYNHLGGNTASIYGRAAALPLKQALADAIAAYGEGLTASIFGQWDVSDHAPFGWQGFHACLLIEGGWAHNTNYHKLTDSVDTPGFIDYQFATRITRSTVGYLATVAVLVPEPVAAALFGSGLVWLILLRRTRRR